tara:strand:+ start:113 stop:514 length:402 start_codon:yes stop_codon:yes gene_type:complete
MKLQDISFLPDDILRNIFYYLSSPFNGLLKNEINYLTSNPFEPGEYILLKAKGNPIWRGQWANLRGREFQFVKERYNPYRLVNGIASPYGISENTFLIHLKSLKYLKMKTLKLLYPLLKAKSKKEMIIQIMKH